MIAVIFEVTPAEGRREDCLGIAAALRAELEAIEGFVSVERFESLNTPGRILSRSFWKDGLEDRAQAPDDSKAVHT